jgi:hypothetical protein
MFEAVSRGRAMALGKRGTSMRRLSRFAATTAITALLAGAGAQSAFGVSDTVTVGSGSAVTFHPFTIPPNTGCVRWSEDGSYNCDPVNVVFPNRSPAQVRDLLRSKGWTTFDLGSTQYLHFAAPALVAQSVQVFRPDGRNSAGQSVRYHVRLWAVPGIASTVTVGAVHHEARVGFTDVIDRSWDASEAFVAGQLCAPNCAQTGVLTKQNQMQGGDGVWRGWANDARATVVP